MKFSLKLIYILNLWLDSHQSSTGIPSGQLKSLLCFGDLDPIFKVKVMYVGYLLNQWMEFLQTYINVPLGQA